MIPDKETVPQIHLWYEAYRSQLTRLALMLGYQIEDAEDFVNQFFLDLLEKNIDQSSITSPQAFLSTAFRRKLTDHYRKFKAKPKLYVVGDEINDRLGEPSARDTIELFDHNSELVKQIRKIFDTLPERCQKVIYLKFYKGLNTEEISLQTGLTKRSVYNNLYEGIRIMRSGMVQERPGVSYTAMLSLLPLLYFC